jgi:hypothetical protein
MRHHHLRTLSLIAALLVTGIAAISAFLILPTSAAHAAMVLTEAQAREKAVGILKGDPYGKTPKDVVGNIKTGQLISAGTSNCSGQRVGFPVWEFHVVVPKERMTNGDGEIDGWLALDARNGKMVCAGLPFLD